MLRNGEFLEASCLEIGTSLFPLYRAEARGYETVVQQTTFAWSPTHRLADQWNLRHNIYSANENEHRHHLDHNRRNNAPTNIVRMNIKEHLKEHNTERALDKEFAMKMSNIQKEVFRTKSQDPEWYSKFIVKCKAAANKFWHSSDLEVQRQAFLKKAVERGVNMSGDERQKRSDKMRTYAILESSKNRASEMLKKYWKDPLFCEARKKNARELNIRNEITEDKVEKALEQTGTIRGAAALLGCDRTVFRRFPELIMRFKSHPLKDRLTEEIVEREIHRSGSVSKAAYRLGVMVEDILKFDRSVSTLYGVRINNNHKVKEIREVKETQDVYCLTASEFGNFALESGVFVKNCGAIVNVTPIESGFEGNVVIEISNSTNLPMKIYALEGISQFVFFRGDRACKTSYADRDGKYQKQTGVTLPKV